jgi:hypothetical protein
MNFQKHNYTICYKKISLLNIKLDNLVNVVCYYPPANRSLLVREGRCDRLERAGKARASVIGPSVGIAFPDTSRPSHRPGDPDQKETEAPARMQTLFHRSLFSVMICRNMYFIFLSDNKYFSIWTGKNKK